MSSWSLHNRLVLPVVLTPWVEGLKSLLALVNDVFVT